MEPILRETGTVEASEILYFENAQIEKIKGNASVFAAMGTLSVLYFKSYDRFVLQINDWRFPLISRLPIVADKHDNNERSYILPAANGFSFRLHLGNIQSFQALNNFEKILSENSNFSFRGEETPFRESGASPDDKLVRQVKKDTGLKETITQTLKHGMKKAKNVAGTVKTGTIDIESRKKAINMRELRNKNYRKTAHSTFTQGFFEAGMKLTEEFVRERTMNSNFHQEKDIKNLKVGYQLPRMFISKEEIEDRIIDNKELASRGNIHLSGFEGERQRGRVAGEKTTGFVDSLKQGLKDIKNTFADMLSGPQVNESATGQGPMERHEVPRHANPLVHDTKVTETLHHYQG